MDINLHSEVKYGFNYADFCEARIISSFWAHLQNFEKRLFTASCLSLSMGQLSFHWTDFYEIWYVSIFRKFVAKRQVSLKYDKNDK